MRKSSKPAAVKPVSATLAAITTALSSGDVSPVAPAASDLSGLAALGRSIANAATVANATKPDAKAEAKAAADAIAAAARGVARAGYNGPSLSVRNGNPKLAALIARAQNPIQIAESLTPRDLSGLAAIKANCDEAGAFDPLAIKLDAGVCSRLASRGLIAANADASGLTLTERGRTTKA